MPRHAEVLGQQLAGEDPVGGEVFHSLAEVDHGRLRRRLVFLPQIDVQRRDATLDVGVMDYDVAVRRGHGSVGLSPELLDQLGGKPGRVELQVLELLGLDQAAGSVVPEDEAVVAADRGGGHRLDGGEVIPDHFEDHVVAGHREDDHHHAGRAGRDLEAAAALAQPAEEVAVELRLAVLVVAQRDVELGDRLAGQQLLQVADELEGRPQVDVEMGAREAEENADVLDVGQHRVDHDAAVPVQQRQHERRGGRSCAQPADQIGALPAEERRRQDLRAGHRALLDSEGLQLASQQCCTASGISLQVFVAAAKPGVAEDRLQ